MIGRLCFQWLNCKPTRFRPIVFTYLFSTLQTDFTARLNNVEANRKDGWTGAHYIRAMHSIKKRDRRLVLSYLLLDMSRILHRTHLAGGRFGDDSDLLFVLLAVFVGHAEGRPMTAGKIGAYLDKPRTTVLRRLESLAGRGVIRSDQGKYRMVASRVSGDTSAADQMTRMIIAAAAKLSKLDT